MCLDDFLDISPAEFSEIYESWLEIENSKYREEWNRARWMVFKTLCPPDKKEITVLDIEQFEWDPKLPEVPISTPERFEEMKKKYGQRLQTGDRNSSKR